LKELALSLSRNEYSGKVRGYTSDTVVWQDKVDIPLHAVDLQNGLSVIRINCRTESSDPEDNTFEIGVLLDMRQALYLRNTLDNFIWAELNRTINAED
jgi:hypothetical protein